MSFRNGGMSRPSYYTHQQWVDGEIRRLWMAMRSDNYFAAPLPVAPTLSILGSLDSTDIDGIYEMAPSGDYCYITRPSDSTVTVVDVSNPASINTVGDIQDLDDLGNPNGIVYESGYCYVADSGSDALTVVNVSTPSSPSIEGSIYDADLNEAYGIVKDGDYCYVSTRGGTFVVVDVSDPADPQVAGSVTNAVFGDCYYVVKEGNFCYVSDYSGKLIIVNVTTPTAPTVAGSVTDATNLAGALGITKIGDFCYVVCYSTDRVTAVRVENTSFPTVGTTIQDSSYFDRGWGMVNYDDNFFFTAGRANGNDRVTIMNATTPGAQTIEGEFSDGGNDIYWPSQLAIDGSRLYVRSDVDNQITILEIT